VLFFNLLLVVLGLHVAHHCDIFGPSFRIVDLLREFLGACIRFVPHALLQNPVQLISRVIVVILLMHD
jgi:hypothetical protein